MWDLAPRLLREPASPSSMAPLRLMTEGISLLCVPISSDWGGVTTVSSSSALFNSFFYAWASASPPPAPQTQDSMTSVTTPQATSSKCCPQSGPGGPSCNHLSPLSLDSLHSTCPGLCMLFNTSAPLLPGALHMHICCQASPQPALCSRSVRQAPVILPPQPCSPVCTKAMG